MVDLQVEAREKLLGEYRRENVRSEIPSLRAVDEKGNIPVNNRLPYAKIAVLYITNECPVMCAHCFAHSGGKLRGDTPLPTIKKFIDEAVESEATSQIIFSGGEPFVALEGLTYALELAKENNFETGIVTSSNWGETYEKAKNILEPIADKIDYLYLSMDIFHQMKIPVDHVRHVARAANESGIECVICNTINEEQVNQGSPHDQYAYDLAEELQIPIHSWPLFGNGRAEKLKSHLPDLNADQPCGKISRPVVYPNGDMHACCFGADKFGPGHPLYRGNIQNKTLQQTIDENSRDRFIQAIRTIGPVQMMELLGEDTSIFNSQCAACHTMTGMENVVKRFEDKLTENPEVINLITRTRELSGDCSPHDHLIGH